MPDENTLPPEFTRLIRQARVQFSTDNTANASWSFEPMEEEGTPMPSGAVLTPLPEPWQWYSSATDGGGRIYIAADALQRPDLHDLYVSIAAWARENGAALNEYNSAPVARNGHAYVPTMFQVWNVARYGYAFWEPPELVECDCGTASPHWVVACPGCGSRLTCPRCGSRSGTITDDGCAGCSQECASEGCERRTDQSEWCEDHRAEFLCERFEHYFFMHIDERPTEDTDGNMVCPTHAENLCPGCNRMVMQRPRRRSLIPDEPEMPLFVEVEGFDQPVCRRCYREAVAGTGEEEFDEDTLLTATELALPTIEGREQIRMCGIEIEGADGTRGAVHLARALYEMGVSNTDDVMGYHHGNGAGFAHVERDSSVDWELVIGPVNMANAKHVQKLNRVVKHVRDWVHAEHLKLDLRCGLHIHVGAERVGLAAAYNLHHLYTFIEDPLYRLGAAKWSLHRTVVADRGLHYCQLVPKETNKTRFARAVQGNRYYGLSFNNYLAAMLNHCRCGATQYDSWDECECELGKCTFEFRLFNTTANPRKLHAYLALTQALVAKALTLPEQSADDWPALPFIPKRVKDLTDDERAELFPAWEQRLEWIFRELPLTPEERASVRYCVVNSELNQLGDSIIEQTYNQEVPA